MQGLNKITSGTKAWANSNVNLFFGCEHDCRYCYAKKMAIRFKRKTEETWKVMELNQKMLEKNFKKRKGRVMFPSSHDILPEYMEQCFIILKRLLKVENTVLITTKPHLSVIQELCEEFIPYKRLIQFRFTITSLNNDLLKFWEPGAPTFEERFEALKNAKSLGYKTSVSIEPFLDQNPIPLVKKLKPYITESIWLGKMNYIKRNDFKNHEISFYKAIRQNYTRENLQTIVNQLKRHDKIRFKDSIRNYFPNLLVLDNLKNLPPSLQI